MQRIATIFTTLVLAGGLAGAAGAADGVLIKDRATDAGESYCHMKFSAIDENTLSSDHPRLKPAADGDFIDFYGPCDEEPTGKDQVMQQRFDESAMRSLDYDD
jgi:hypothetical protein